jgi:hypothetical protein
VDQGGLRVVWHSEYDQGYLDFESKKEVVELLLNLRGEAIVSLFDEVKE